MSNRIQCEVLSAEALKTSLGFRRLCWLWDPVVHGFRQFSWIAYRRRRCVWCSQACVRSNGPSITRAATCWRDLEIRQGMSHPFPDHSETCKKIPIHHHPAVLRGIDASHSWPDPYMARQRREDMKRPRNPPKETPTPRSFAQKYHIGKGGDVGRIVRSRQV